MTTIVPTEVDIKRIQAVFLKAHLLLMSAGMKNSQISGKEMLAKVTNITGKTYKRGQYGIARKDLIDWLEAN
jgi:hypothetical protein